MLKKNLKYILLVTAFALFGISLFWENHLANKFNNRAELTSGAQQTLQSCELRVDQFLDQLMTRVPNRALPGQLSSVLDDVSGLPNGLTILVYQNDSLVWWSDNTIAPESLHELPATGYSMLLHKNGWYETFRRNSGPYTIAGLLKVRNQYVIQNRFLTNDFTAPIQLPPTASVTLKKTGYEINSYKNNYLFSVDFPSGDLYEHGNAWIATIYLLAYILFLVAFYLICDHFFVTGYKAGIATFMIVVLTRLISVLYTFPKSLYDQPLFSPNYYASSFLLNSLGDLLISALLIVYLVSMVYQLSRSKLILARFEKTAWFKSVTIIGVVSVIFLYSVFINYLLSGLILNSRISFNINNVFELDIYSLVGVFIMGILLFSFYLVCDGGVRLIRKTGKPLSIIFLWFIITQGIFLGLLIFFHDSSFFSEYGAGAFLLTNFLVLYCGYIRHNAGNIYAFTRYLLIIFGFSIYAALTISEFNKVRERENRKILAGKLENEQDQTAEYLFNDIAEKAAKDKFISSYFSIPYEQIINTTANGDVVTRRFTQLYFTGYWSKYDISIKCFNKEGLPVNSGGDPTWNLDYFNLIIREDGKPTYSPYLFYLNNTAGRISYIGRIPVYSENNPGDQTGTIIINIISKILQDEAGFPELLLSDKIPQKKDISNYSYARYKNNVLVSQNGKYNYTLSAKAYNSLRNTKQTEQFINNDGYSHLFYNTGDDGLLVVSYKNPGILEFITLFSYLFSFYSICYILIYTIQALAKNNGKIVINFKNRIQASVIIIVVTAMLMIGGATVYYIFNNYVTNLGISVNERLKSMLIAIQDELSKRSLEEEEISDEMNYSFSKLAGTLSIDFNIYDNRGRLIYSTQPKIFDQEIIARTMNREALKQLSGNNKSLHIQFEKIGNLQYLSAYEPVRNSNLNNIGFINLPYFARQDELKKDISSFLVALINIYVLLFAFSIFITFIVSNRITKPLQIIQQRLGKIRLGKRNELIEWDQDDEIGALVKEYNRMVSELAESADMLAKSERESAWREMAKQVAHEIKNPLTPMKLSVQHLQRAWKEKSPNLESIMQRFSQTLIEQIDTLSNIATEFSNFAKMPKANNETIDVTAIIKSTINLYGEAENVMITYYEHHNGPFKILADKDQLIRVFSNLIKNAIQSIPDGQNGHIHIDVNNIDDHVLISIKDNGSGIPSDQFDKIFTPNFTTKSGGTGLGLAMVKSIIDLAGGKIWFQSTVNEGTIFFISLPLTNN